MADNMKDPTTAGKFPDGFVWGVATAAPQIEGAAREDGKGLSIWDVFAKKAGAVKNGENLDVACDHYHRYKEDVALIASLGFKNYRLSIAWPRIFPDGVGAINPKGIDFYHRLIDSLLAAGITPWVTMFHWDLPQALETKGGWRSRVVVDAFADYADEIVKRFGDRVKNWITLNEIFCFAELGYGAGVHAPGVQEGDAVVTQAYHHALVCHGHGVRAVRQHGGAGARVGLTDNSTVLIPLTETARDIAATKELFAAENCRVLGPIFNGHYGEDYRKLVGKDFPKIAATDFELISQPSDFLGMNIYTGSVVRSAPSGKAEHVAYPNHYPTADSDWLKLNARSMYWGPRLVAEVYGIKNVYVTENGAGYDEAPPVQGEVFDLHRLEYVRSCLRELKRGIDDGSPTRGYFLWSLMDNFEWADGYGRRFGIVYTDFATQKRTPKASAYWYGKICKLNGLV